MLFSKLFFKKFIWLLVLILSNSIMAQNEPQANDVDQFAWDFARPGFDKDQVYSTINYDYNVSLSSGAFVLTQSDLHVLGMRGLDINIKRTYSSKVYQEYTSPMVPCSHSWHEADDIGFGPGWWFGFARIGHFFSGFQQQLALQWGDGSVEIIYDDHRLQDYNLPPWHDFDITDKFTRIYYNTDVSGDKIYKIITMNGTVYTVDWNPTGIYGPDNYYCTRIEDKYGNKINITYHTINGYKSNLIHTITEQTNNVSGYTRVYTFEVVDDHYSKCIYNINSTETVEIRYNYITKTITRELDYVTHKILQDVTYWKDNQQINHGSHYAYNNVLEMTSLNFNTGGSLDITYDYMPVIDDFSNPSNHDSRGVIETSLNTSNEPIITTYDYNASGTTTAYSYDDNIKITGSPYDPIMNYFNTTKVTYGDNSYKIYKHEINENGTLPLRRGLLREIEEYDINGNLEKKTFKTYVNLKLTSLWTDLTRWGMTCLLAAEMSAQYENGQIIKVYHSRNRVNKNEIISHVYGNAGDATYCEDNGYNPYGLPQYFMNYGEIQSFGITYKMPGFSGFEYFEWVDKNPNNINDNRLTKIAYIDGSNTLNPPNDPWQDGDDFYYTTNGTPYSDRILNHKQIIKFFEFDELNIQVESLKNLYTYQTFGNIEKIEQYDMQETVPEDTYKKIEYEEDATNGNITKKIIFNGSSPNEVKQYEYAIEYGKRYVTKYTETDANYPTNDLEKEFEYNYYTGKATSNSSYNGDLTNYQYDELGRLIKIAEPGDDIATTPTQEIEYFDFHDTERDYNMVKVRSKKNTNYLNSTYYLYDKHGRLTQNQQINSDNISNTNKNVSAAIGEQKSEIDEDSKTVEIDYDQNINWNCNIWEEDPGQVSAYFKIFQNGVLKVHKYSNGSYSGNLNVNKGDVCLMVARVSGRDEVGGSAQGQINYEKYDGITLQAFDYDNKGNLKFSSNFLGVPGDNESIGAPVSDVWSITGLLKTEFEHDAFNRTIQVIHPDGTINNNTYGPNFSISINENGNKSKSFSDAFGNVVSDIQDFEGTYPGPITTTFEYDNFNNLIEVGSPLGSAYNRTYSYNNFGNMLNQNLPASSKETDYLYDAVGRLRLYRDQNLKNIFYDGDSEKTGFYYNKYDKYGRVIEVGKFNPAVYYGEFGDDYLFTEQSARNVTFPGNVKIGPKTSITFEDLAHKYKNIYYDEYPTAIPDPALDNPKGNITEIHFDAASKKIVYYYDDRDRIRKVIYDIGIQNNDPTGQNEQIVEYEYDKSNNVIKYSIKNGSDHCYFWYDYDNYGNLFQVYSNEQDAKVSAKLEVEYNYTIDNLIKEIKLGNISGTEFAETLNYEYNERRWLNNINAPNGVENLNLANPETNFAMDLAYNYNADHGSAGNIKTAIYYTKMPDPHTSSPTQSHYHKYEFEYDNIDRLLTADFSAAQLTLPSTFNWSSSNAYKLFIPEYNNGYDLAGNIKSLFRGDQNSVIDEYNYFYKPNSHKLDYVMGYNSQSAGNYSYDANGNLKGDNEKNITSISFEYRNLPTYILYGDGNKIYYTYDQDGNRRTKRLNNEMTQYYLNGPDGKTLAVYDENGKLIFYNIWGHDLIGKIY